MRRNVPSLIILFVLLLPNITFCQSGGKGIFRFLNLPNASKTAALGNAYPISTNADFTAAFQNPSLIQSDFNGQLAVNYSNYISDINFGSLQYGFKLPHTKVISAGIMFINYGNFEETDATGNATGNTFTAGDYLLNIGYAENWKQKIFYGANLKLIYGSYDIYKSLAVATDLSVSYQDSVKNIATGFILKNIGYQLKPFDNQRESLPFEIDFSFSQKLNHAPLRYHISYHHLQNFKLSYQDPNDPNMELDLINGVPLAQQSKFIQNFSRHLILGTELLLSPSFNLHAGYNLQRSKELNITSTGGLAGFSFGFLLNLKKMSFSYAHSSLNAAGGNNYFSILLKPSVFKSRQP